MPGTLYLVPNLLGVVEPARVLPTHTLDVARTLRHWVVETPKAARAFLGTLALGVPIASLSIEPLGDATDEATLRARLAPAIEGHDLGMVSDAGCPGVADPGARLVAAAHAHGVRVVPLVGPSSLLLALMASGMNGQRFAFHGYLPSSPDARAEALRRLEKISRSDDCTQLFIETPYRNVAMLETMRTTLQPSTRVAVAVDLTLPEESVVSQAVAAWRRADVAAYAKRPAIFLLHAAEASRGLQADARRPPGHASR